MASLLQRSLNAAGFWVIDPIGSLRFSPDHRNGILSQAAKAATWWEDFCSDSGMNEEHQFAPKL